MKPRATANRYRLRIEQIAPSTQAMRRDVQGGRVVNDAQAAPVRRFDMHRPERRFPLRPLAERQRVALPTATFKPLLPLDLHRLCKGLSPTTTFSWRFMGVPGVGPVTTLAFRTAIDDPARFVRSRDVGAYLGLAPKRFQLGTSVDWDGRISRQGDDEVRTLLYEAASGLLVRNKACPRSWPGAS
jgi:Transposase IS116/IS110/IS902 family